MSPPDTFAEERSSLLGELSKTAFVIPDGLSYDEWADMGHTLVSIAQSAMWWVGDWLLYGEHHYGEKYTQAIDATGYGLSTLKNAQWVADRFPPEERREDATFSQHKAVAALEKSPRRDLLARAAEEGMTIGELNGRVKALKTEPERDTSTVEVIVPEPPRTRTDAIDRTIAVLEQASLREDWSLVKQAVEILVSCKELP